MNELVVFSHLRWGFVYQRPQQILSRLARRYLHVRPKGPTGTDQRGLYLNKRFFADAGMLATLNGMGYGWLDSGPLVEPT